LEHGEPHERSAIIKQLAGQIVKMSQQKFASNVVEKCLTFGGPVERQILVNEMLGSTDENEPLQVCCLLNENVSQVYAFSRFQGRHPCFNLFVSALFKEYILVTCMSIIFSKIRNRSLTIGLGCLVPLVISSSWMITFPRVIFKYCQLRHLPFLISDLFA